MTSRNKITILNAASAMLLTFVNGLLGIIVTKLVIEHFGSDFNGLNSTANQIINVLLVIEGGFTLASNVVLFAPLGEKDYSLVNHILYITRKKFHVIGVLFAITGLFVSLVYTLAINSGLQSYLVFSVIIMAVIPSAFNLFYATTYRVLIQTMQKEYVLNFANVLTIGLGHVTTIIMILLNGSVWMVRLITMVFALINSLLIVIYAKRKCTYLDIRDNDYDIVIPGTRDVMIQKVTGIVYNAAPIVFLSVSPSGGTVLASVYAVYNNIFNMIKSVLRSIIDAPRLSIGHMIANDEKERVWDIFYQYEFIAISALFVVCTTSFVLVLPFVSIYTAGITDACYYDMLIANMMVLITVFEIIHIPSGHLINMAGKFKISMIFQSIACVVLILTMAIGGIHWGIYGLIFAVLVVAILLAVLEMGYVHMHFFKSKLTALCKILLPYLIGGSIIGIIEIRYIGAISSYLDFFLYGIVLTIINTFFVVLISMLFSKKMLFSVIVRVMNFMKKNRRNE